MESALEWLDGPGRHARAPERAQAVAEIAAAALDASAWSVSETSPDAGAVHTTLSADRRLGAGSVTEAHETFPLWRSCAMAALFTWTPRIPRPTPASGCCWCAAGGTQLLAAGASGRLVELYGDGATLPMGRAAATLRLLVREAVSPVAPSA